MMRWLPVGRRWILSPHLAFVCRLVLGGVFVAAGWSKIGHQAEVVQTVLGYNILPGFLVRPFSLTLPWLELISGVLLILGLLLPSASALSALLTLAFMYAIGINLWRGASIDCGCFGPGEALSWGVFARDAGLLLISLQILAAKQGSLSLQRGLSALWRLRSWG